MSIKGVDVSHWNETVNFTELKNAGISFVIPTDGYARTEDKRFVENVKNARAAGLTVPAIYHFSYALSEADAVREADFAVEMANKVGLPKNGIIFYDFEYDTVRYATQVGVTLTSKHANAFTWAFCKRVEEKGYRAGVYTNIDYYLHWFTDHSLFNTYVTWLADLNGGPDYPCDIQQWTFELTINGKAFDGNVWLNESLYNSIIQSEDTGITIQESGRQAIIKAAESYLDVTENDAKFREILDIYNSHEPLARGYAIQPNDQWCDAFVSAMAIKAGVVDAVGTEVSCEKHIEIFKQKNIWVEDGTIIPEPGDIILYNWDDGSQPNDGVADHIGIVSAYNPYGNYITIVEGNYHEKVAKRTIVVGWGYIRGYAKPNYPVESAAVSYEQPAIKYSIYELVNQVLNGDWGNGEERKQRLEAAGYVYADVQTAVDRKVSGKSVSSGKSIIALANEVIDGKWGNGDERKQRLEDSGYDYKTVQAAVNELLNKHDLERVARQVIAGVYGNGEERKQRLEAAGYVYADVQRVVNNMLR